MPFFRRIVRNYFTFNRRERRGIVVLLSVISGLAVTHGIIRYMPSAEADYRFQALNVIDSLQNRSTESLPIKTAETSEAPKPVSWSQFDPNTVTQERLVTLGLDSSIAQRIINYRKSGGKFKQPEDLKKIYGLSQDWFDEAVGFIQMEKQPEKSDNDFSASPFESDTANKQKRFAKIEVFELNTVDSATLVKVPWIGPFTAGEIVELRSKLHGFRSYDQLLDVYRISDQAIENILKHSSLDTSLVSPINLNTCDLKTLGSHPYLTWKQARIILNYRHQHGPYKSIDGILNTSVINDSVYSKLAPYLTVGK